MSDDPARVALDAVIAEEQKDPFYDSSLPQLVQLAPRRFLVDHLNYCHAQSGSDWATHRIYLVEVEGTRVTSLKQVADLHISERWWDDGYDRAAAVADARTKLVG